MSKDKIMRRGITDFVISAPPELPRAETRSLNGTLFVAAEPIRLWLTDRPRAQRLQAPFIKLMVWFWDKELLPEYRAVYGLGVCTVRVPIALSELRRCAGDHRWVLRHVKQALACLAERGWQWPDLETFIDDLANQEMPLSHTFEQMKKMHRRSGTACVPWISFRPGESTVGVRFASAQGQRDVVVHRERGPLPVNTMFGDWGPLVKTSIKGDDFRLMDKNGNVLATVPITEAGAPG